MDDGLAEKLFNAYYAPLVARGLLMPCTWDEMDGEDREPWQSAAAAARQEASAKQNAEVEMLRGAIEGWQRAGARFHLELHEALGFHPGDLHDFTWQDLLNAVRRDLSMLNAVRRAVEG